MTTLLTILGTVAATLLVSALVKNLSSGQRKIEYRIGPMAVGEPLFERCMSHLLGPPVVAGNRIVLAQFLPTMFLFVRSLSFAQNHNLAIRAFGRRVNASAISHIILLILVLYLCFVFTHRISTKYGGE